jgi:hypothetical protein
MKTVAIFVAIVAVTAATAAQADPRPKLHFPGAPIKQGSYCWVYTDAHGHGWWDTCDSSAPTPRGMSLRGRSESDISQIESGGNGDGGGGGGGGGGAR